MFQIRSMIVADIPLGMRLKQQAGWNQLEGDWRRFLDLEPDGCFVAELEGSAVGTVTTCAFGPVAWVAMMLVEESYRGRGIGRSLMKHALDYLDRSGATTVRLDATSLGQPLYEKLGFAAEYQLSRYEGILPKGPEEPRALPCRPEYLPDLLRLDLAATATGRARLLRRFYEEHPEKMCVVQDEGAVAGYLAARPGSRAWQIGPCIATDETGAILFAEAAHRFGGQQVFIDIPAGNEPACQIARSWGLTVSRSFIRMSRGVMIPDLVDSLWASSGPEMG